MNTFKNFLHSLKRYTTASILNILGLSVAFASFMIIAIQVKYDLTFDRHYKNADRIYRIEIMDNSGKYGPYMDRPSAVRMAGASSDIEKCGMLKIYGVTAAYDRDKGKSSLLTGLPFCKAEPEALDVLEFDFLQGDAKRFAEPNTVIVSQQLAKSLYGNENPVGRSIVYPIDLYTDPTDSPREIVGVYKKFPKNSHLRQNAIVEFIGDTDISAAGNRSYNFFLRLTSPEKREQAERKMLSEYVKFQNEINDTGIPKTEKESKLRLLPIADIHFSTDIVSYDVVEKINPGTVGSLAVIALLIIVIATINFVNFAMAQVPLRIRSVNTQKIFGRTNGSIRKYLIAESVGLTIMALLIALAAVKLLAPSRLFSGIGVSDATLSPPILLLTSVTAVLTGIVAGAYPAFYITAFRPALVLNRSFGLSVKGRLLRTALIAFQYVISIILIITALSVREQYRYMKNFDMGFSVENILTTYLSPEAASHKDALVDQLKSNPDIVDVTFSEGPFVSTGWAQWGQTFKGKYVSFEVCRVASNFISFMGLKIIEGRDFTESDNLKPEYTPIFNRKARVQDSIMVGDNIRGMTVAGIVEDFNFKPLQYGIEPFAFVNQGEYAKSRPPFRNMFVKVNTHNIAGAIDDIRRTLSEFDPDGPKEIRFMDESIGKLYEKEQVLSTQITLFSLLSILIAVIGVFGLVLFETRYRRKEIGLRKIYGATVGTILRIFNGRYLRIIAVCFVVAAPIAYWIVKRWLENFAYKMPIPAWTFAAALLVVLAVTVVTISLQSYKTANRNPIKSIRTE